LLRLDLGLAVSIDDLTVVILVSITTTTTATTIITS
jgi:hypothetical protein